MSWQFDDTLRLLEGLALNRDAVQRKLRAIPEVDLSDVEYWVKAQLFNDEEWDAKLFDNFHRVIVDTGFLQRLRLWLGPQVWEECGAALADRPPSSPNG